MSAPNSLQRTFTGIRGTGVTDARSGRARATTGLLRAIALLVAACGLLSVCTTAASAATWKWSKTYALPGSPHGIEGISCPSASLCVAVGNSGSLAKHNASDNVYWTTNPARGRSAWHVAALEPELQPAIGPAGEVLSGVSCAQLARGVDCALSDGFANLWRTSHPTGGKRAWRVSVPNDTGLLALSCWSAWCGALDAYGDALVTNGARVQSDLSVFNVPDGIDQAAVGCNAAAFCAAVDLTSTVTWTDHATKRRAVWHFANLRGGSDLDTIACPTIKLCVVTEGQNSGTAWIGVSRNPAGGVGTWASVELPASLGPSIYTVACQSASLCAIGGQNFVLTSTDPAAKLSAWQRSNVPFEVENLSCPTATECVATEGGGDEVIVGRLVSSHR